MNLPSVAPTTELEESLQALASGLSAELDPGVSESAFCIRIVGEFSVGKSRFLAEMLRGRVSDHLLPTSNLAPETKFSLEVTHGDEERLCVINRAVDEVTDPEIAATLEEFPTRRELEELGYVDQNQYRLRLTVDAPELVWDSDPLAMEEDKSAPTRIYLVDTPGWQASEDDIVEFELGLTPPAAIFVTSPVRLQNRALIEHFVDFAEEVSYCEPIDGHKLTVVPVVTHWKESEIASEKLDEVLNQVEDKLDDRQHQMVDPLCVELSEYSEDELDQIRDRFWNLMASADPTPGVNAPGSRPSDVSRLVDSWELKKAFEQAATALDRGDQLLDGLGTPPRPFSGMNMTRLKVYLDDDRHVQKLRRTMRREFEITEETADELAFHPPQLDADHPLHHWWNNHFLPTVGGAVQSLSKLTERLWALPDRVTENIDDLTDWTRHEIEEPWTKARNNALAARLLFPTGLREAVRDGAPQSEIVATMLSAQCSQTALLELLNHAVRQTGE